MSTIYELESYGSRYRMSTKFYPESPSHLQNVVYKIFAAKNL
jgi:hypothetical protein